MWTGSLLQDGGREPTVLQLPLCRWVCGAPCNSCLLKHDMHMLILTRNNPTPLPSRLVMTLVTTVPCVTQCPPARIYDPNLFRVVPNPDFRLAAGDLCVLECPGEQCDWSVSGLVIFLFWANLIGQLCSQFSPWGGNCAH